MVSNREPYKVESRSGRTVLEKTVGGLVSALESILRKNGGTWVYWGRKGQKTPLSSSSARSSP